MFHVPNVWRVREGKMASSELQGNNGAFIIPVAQSGVLVNVVASDGEGWEHVSVSLPYRAPMWYEMNYIKDMFWDPEDCVVQYHPPKKDYVNVHPYCLHMWLPIGYVLPRPPTWMIA